MRPILARGLAALTLSTSGFGAMMIAPGVAHASGGYGGGATTQVTFALNCNHPGAPCSQIFGYGGIWGWIALTPGESPTAGTLNAQVTDCGHNLPVSPGLSGPTGAGHTGYDGTWMEIGPLGSPPSPITPRDPHGMYLVFTDSISNELGIPPMPASYGHYPVSFAGAEGQETIAP